MVHMMTFSEVLSTTAATFWRAAPLTMWEEVPKAEKSGWGEGCLEPLVLSRAGWGQEQCHNMQRRSLKRWRLETLWAVESVVASEGLLVTTQTDSLSQSPHLFLFIWFIILNCSVLSHIPFKLDSPISISFLPLPLPSPKGRKGCCVINSSNQSICL